MKPADLSLLRCPACGGSLDFQGTLGAGRLVKGELTCAGCDAHWPVRDGLPRLYVEDEVGGSDRLMRFMYNVFHRVHDPAVTWLLPLLEFGRESTLRNGYMRRLNLGSLRPGREGEPIRILETGIGGGANVPLMRRDLPEGLPVEVWGFDLSEGMLRDCRRQFGDQETLPLRLFMADAHRLPFPDHTFDRVFHVGGIGGFRDPAAALLEMARVARPGTPIVVVDEQLDANRRNTLYHRLGFKLVTFYDRNPKAPTRMLPAGARDVIEEQVSRFYYCLTFTMDARGH